MLPLREQVHEALSLLTVPAAPRLIATVHEAFFSTSFSSAKLTSLKRDEERSFRAAPFARPYYICATLSSDLLAPARGLLAVSTWPMDKRVIGSLSPRVDFLTAAMRVADAIERIPAPVAAARRLLWRFAASIPGAADSAELMEPSTVRAAAEAELRVHADADRDTRAAAATRPRAQLDDAEQLYGAQLQAAGTRRKRREIGDGVAAPDRARPGGPAEPQRAHDRRAGRQSRMYQDGNSGWDRSGQAGTGRVPGTLAPRPNRSTPLSASGLHCGAA